MEKVALAIQQLYPQVFHACHTRHRRGKGGEWRVSERDAAVLAHVGPGFRPTAGELARHMGIGAPTMSEALKRLERLGLVEREAGTDRRRRTIGLTERGERALAAGSVLEPARLERLIGQLSERERAAAVRGLALLARAARRVAELEQRR